MPETPLPIVLKNSPEWNAWLSYYDRIKSPRANVMRRWGYQSWTVPSEFPPVETDQPKVKKGPKR